MKRFLQLVDEYHDYDKAKVVILPVPFEGTVSYGKGTAKGPQAIIEASTQLELFDEETLSEPYTQGICTLEPILGQDAKEVAENVRERCMKLLNDKKFIMMLGGEHSISLGLCSALTVKEKFSVLQIDAHADLRDEFELDRYSHACVMKRVSDMGVPLVQVGIRAISREEYDSLSKIDTKMFFAKELEGNWIERVVSSLSDNVYITLDIDGLDPSIMPATGTPEPGGLNWKDVLELLHEVFLKKKVLACDMVEFAPDGSHVHDFVAARLVHKILAYRQALQKA